MTSLATIWAAIDPLYGFVFLGLFSPGPNVILLTTSGARFGFRATLPHLFGVVIGVGIVAGLTAFGIGALLLRWPVLEWSLKIGAALWMMWMARGLWLSPPPGQADDARPFTMLQAALFQWINPKIWAVALAASSGFASGQGPTGEAIRLALAFSGLNLFCCLFWSAAGAALSYLLTHPPMWRIFARVMAVGLFGFTLILLV